MKSWIEGDSAEFVLKYNQSAIYVNTRVDKDDA